MGITVLREMWRKLQVVRMEHSVEPSGARSREHSGTRRSSFRDPALCFEHSPERNQRQEVSWRRVKERVWRR